MPISFGFFGPATCRNIELSSDLLLSFYLYWPCSLRSQRTRENSYRSDTPRRRQSTGHTLEQSYSSIITDDSAPPPLRARFDHLRGFMADQNHNQSQPLAPGATSSTNYGTLPTASGLTMNSNSKRGRRARQNMSPTGPGFPRTNTRGSQYSRQESPLAIRRPISVAGLKETLKDGWRSTLKRTPSTYDPPLVDTMSEERDDTEASRINGVRVWYSSFTSIDWLHDAVSRIITHVDDIFYRLMIR